MCGRYAVQHDPAALAAEFDALDRSGGALGPDYNVTPTKTVPIVVERLVSAGSGQSRPSPSGAGPRSSERSVRPVRWGLVPQWAKDMRSGPPMINARAESIVSKPAFAESAARRRCLVPAAGWYEWKPGDGRRQPYFCARHDGASLAMAGVFSAWWPPDAPDNGPLVSCAVVTTAAAGEFADIHHRMPLLLPADRWVDWLDPNRTDPSSLLTGITPGLLEELELRPVSTEVNNMRNNGPHLVERVDPPLDEPGELALFDS